MAAYVLARHPRASPADTRPGGGSVARRSLPAGGPGRLDASPPAGRAAAAAVGGGERAAQSRWRGGLRRRARRPLAGRAEEARAAAVSGAG